MAANIPALSGGPAQRPVGPPEDAALSLENARRALLGRESPPALSRYRLLRRIGEGGMGRIYEAFDPVLRRTVAIKLAHECGDLCSRYAAAHEARMLAAVSHRNVVRIFGVGELASGRLYIVMERLDAIPLHQWRTPSTGWRAVLRAYEQAAAGLAEVHRAGVVHRDFKPANALIDARGLVRVVDFGIARRPADTLGSGFVAGTRRYMAPEQERGLATTPASDQYSFCLALFEALYGVLPFPETDAASLSAAKLRGELPGAPTDARVPSRLHDIIARGLSLAPDDRWPDLEVLRGELAKVRRRRPPAWAVAAAAVAALGIIAAVLPT